MFSLPRDNLLRACISLKCGAAAPEGYVCGKTAPFHSCLGHATSGYKGTGHGHSGDRWECQQLPIRSLHAGTLTLSLPAPPQLWALHGAQAPAALLGPSPQLCPSSSVRFGSAWAPAIWPCEVFQFYICGLSLPVA